MASTIIIRMFHLINLFMIIALLMLYISHNIAGGFGVWINDCGEYQKNELFLERIDDGKKQKLLQQLRRDCETTIIV